MLYVRVRNGIIDNFMNEIDPYFILRKAMSTLEMGLQQHLVTNVLLRPQWHSAEPT